MADRRTEGTVSKATGRTQEAYDLAFVTKELVKLNAENYELRHYLRETVRLLAESVGRDWPENGE